MRMLVSRTARVSFRAPLALALLFGAFLAIGVPRPAHAGDLDRTACAAQPTTSTAGDFTTARKYTSAEARTYDLSAMSVTQSAGKKVSAISIAGAAACVLGPGSTSRIGVQSANDPSARWWSLKQCCDGSGLLLTAAESSVWGPRMDNVALDGIRAANGQGPAHIHEAYLTNIRDDCVTTSHDNITIDDSYLECHTGISWRNVGGTGHTGTPFDLSLTNTLIYIKPMAGNGSGGTCMQWVVNGTANGPVWKMDTKSNAGVPAFHGDASRFTVRNVIVRMDLANHEAPCKTGSNVGQEWPAATYDNVTFVWTSSRPYPGKLPAGVTLTTDTSVFENAKTDWLICHGYQHGVVIPGTGFDTCPGDPPIDAPEVTDAAPSDVTDTSATVHAMVNPRGSDTTYTFEYGTDDTYGHSTDPVDIGAGSDPADAPGFLTGLLPSTIYHYRVDATNAGGTTMETDQTFTTAAPASTGDPPAT
jgi:hypothetical protein